MRGCTNGVFLPSFEVVLEGLGVVHDLSPDGEVPGEEVVVELIVLVFRLVEISFEFIVIYVQTAQGVVSFA